MHDAITASNNVEPKQSGETLPGPSFALVQAKWKQRSVLLRIGIFPTDCDAHFEQTFKTLQKRKGSKLGVFPSTGLEWVNQKNSVRCWHYAWLWETGSRGCQLAWTMYMGRGFQESVAIGQVGTFLLSQPVLAMLHSVVDKGETGSVTR